MSLKTLIKATCTITIIVVATLALTECLLSYYNQKNTAELMPYNTADANLGWTNKTGEYYLSTSNGKTHVTIVNDGRRATSYKSPPFSELDSDVLLTGCSYIFGALISDDETLAWKLQDKYPGLNFSNYGVGAYSTYQALLRLQQRLPAIKDPKVVIYGFIPDHEARNVALQTWIGLIKVPFPYVKLDAKSNLKYLQTSKVATYLRNTEHLTTIEGKINQFLISKPQAQNMARLATTKLILNMNSIAERHGAKFYMVILEGQPEIRKYYLELLPKYGMSVVDCTNPNAIDMRVPGDGHPNAILNTFWADCISEKINLNLIS